MAEETVEEVEARIKADEAELARLEAEKAHEATLATVAAAPLPPIPTHLPPVAALTPMQIKTMREIAAGQKVAANPRTI